MKSKCYLCWLACCAVLFVSCTDTPSEPGPEPPKSDPEQITVDELKIVSFAINPVGNDGIYAPVVFAYDGTWKAGIEHYKADLSALKASFEAVAAKVTVGGEEQVPGQTPNDFTKPMMYRLYADDGQYKEFTVELENGAGTGLPVIAVFTDGGKPVVSKEEWLEGRVVVDPQESGFERLAGTVEIKGRGNNTWRLDKKPYALKLAEKSPVLGMNKHKRWVLLANASDRTLLRNRVAFEIARRTGLAWTPDSRFVEVMLNGKYLGSYLLCEQIRVDKNRVNIPEMTSDDLTGEALTGGYLLEFDRYYDEVNKFRSKYRDLPVNIKEPDEDVLNAEQRAYITGYVNGVEEALYGGDAIDMKYKEMIDIDSFVDWWIVMELTGCRDSRLPGSCYMYKQRSGKLFAGPVWDFDMTTFKGLDSFLLYDYEVDPANPDPADVRNRSLWYAKLFTDPEFKARAGERWRAYKNSEGFDGITAFIDAETQALRSSAAVNWAMWTLDGATNQDEQMAWEDAVAKMRTNYLERLKWLDERVSAW